MIAHDLRTAENADKIYYIENGRIAESGTHEELMALCQQYATMYSLQALRLNGKNSLEGKSVIFSGR